MQIHANEDAAWAEVACLREERDALMQTVADLQRRDVERKNKVRRRERDYETLQDCLRNLLNEKVRTWMLQTWPEIFKACSVLASFPVFMNSGAW